MAVAGAERSAMRKIDTTRVWPRPSFDHLFLLPNVEKILEPVHQVSVAANESTNSVSQSVLVNKILRVQVDELQEFGVISTISDLLLRTVKEGEFFLGGSQTGIRREWF